MSTPGPTIKSAVEAEGSKIWAWIKDKWPHAVTWVLMAYNVVKHL